MTILMNHDQVSVNYTGHNNEEHGQMKKGLQHKVTLIYNRIW